MTLRSARVRLGVCLGGFQLQRSVLEDVRPGVRLGQHRAEPRDNADDGGFSDGGFGDDGTHSEGPPDTNDGVQMFESTRRDPGLDADGSARRAAAEDEQDRWDRRRSELYAVLLERSSRNRALVQSRKAAIRAGVEAAIQAASCQCSACGSKSGLECTRTVPVLWVGQAFTFMLGVPIITCMACGARSAPLPPMAGCFPSTPVRAWDLTKAHDGERPVWFDLSLLQVHSHPLLDVSCVCCPCSPKACAAHALHSQGIMRLPEHQPRTDFALQDTDILQYHQKRIAMEGLCEALMRTHAANGCTDYLSFDSFRKHLGRAVAEYGHAQCASNDVAGLGVEGWPTGILSHCAGCWFAGKAGEVRVSLGCGKAAAYLDSPFACCAQA